MLGGAALGPRVAAAYQAAEQRRAAELDELLTTNGVRFTRISGSTEIRRKLVELSEVYRRAG